MRFKAFLIAATAVMSAGPAMAAGYGDFTGNWQNENAGTNNITRVRVTPSGGGLKVKVWGKCSPSDCDWGSAPATVYGPGPSSNPASSGTDILVTFNNGGIETTLHLEDRPGDRLSYTSFTKFSDSRSPYVSTGTLRKDYGGWPPGGGGGPGGPGGPGGGAGGITLYENVGYGGGSLRLTDNTPNLSPLGWDDIASSIRVAPGETWQVCKHSGYMPPCRTIDSDVSNLLPGGWNDTISSVRRVGGGGAPGGWPPGWPFPPGGGPGGPGGGPAPVTHSTGSLAVPQTWEFDLDEGSVGSNPQADLWFEAVNPYEMYITPRNGARIWVGDGSNRNLAGCSSGGPYTTARVPLGSIPVGTYVCVRTNQGRYSQFRVNSLSGGYPKTLNLGYTTWE